MPVFAQTCLVAFLPLPVSSPRGERGAELGIQADKRSLCLERHKREVWGQLCTVLGRWPGLQSVPRVGAGWHPSLG